MLELLPEVALHEDVFRRRDVFLGVHLHLLEMLDCGRECPQRLVKQDLGRGNDEARRRNAHGMRGGHLRDPVEGSPLQRLRDTSLEDFNH